MTKDTEQTERRAWGFSDIAKATGLSTNFVRNEVKRGRLRARPFGRRRLVLTEDLNAWLASTDDLNGYFGETATKTQAAA
jgi:excisionase family DNA binding protein